MSLMKIAGIAILIVAGWVTVCTVDRFVPTNLVPTVEARVGRPLTPVSVAGTARRTSRRVSRRR